MIQQIDIKWKVASLDNFLGKMLVFILTLRWSITAAAITKRNTVNKENLTTKKVLLTYKKGLLSYKQDLLTKKDLLKNTNGK